ncbi:bifunctional diguanylate cyclase/phosphodiesterase [Devosia sp.]|uniref:bifunctional diguanylate cyclase/phosphodiesterase n=1 Tax=Devosia sp. TaxID=1871048 RepID=UPI003265090B
MQSRSSPIQRRQFSTGVLLPAILALLITASAVLGFVIWSTADIDNRALNRQTTLVAQVMSAQLASIIHEQESVSVWDDAVVNTKLAFNLKWVDANLGQWMFEFFGHNRAIVLDAENRPLYLMKNGKSAPVENYSELSGTIAPIVTKLRADIAAGGLIPFNTKATSVPVSDAEFVIIEGMPAIVSAMPIVSDTRALIQDPGTEIILVNVLFLDAAYSSWLMQDYLFEGAAFSLTRTDDISKSVYPLVSGSGRMVGFFEWRRDRPGQLMLAQTGPALALAFMVAGLLIFLLLRKLHKSSTALEDGRLHAEHQAAHDRLTGLANRASFDAQLARVLTSSGTANSQVTLMMLDLDRFKQVNDTLGHQAGDELLCAVGERLRRVMASTEGSNALSGIEIIARFGGDEFAILHVSRHGIADMMALSATIIQTIEQPFEISRGKAFIGVSVGVVNAATGGTEPRELIRKADIALYQAKSSGSNRAVIYEEHMNEMLQLQRTIEAELREALRRDDQLSVVFQPLVDQATRKTIGAEALSRWNHPKFGQISPAKFIPVAESTGLIESLGDFVLRKACQLGASVPGRTIAVNISPTQLRNPKFATRVFDVLHQTGMRPTDLELEITESILLDDEHVSSQNLRTFRASGIHIALDDFGTGYSSLSYLKRYPVDRIKIDRSFINQLSEGHVSVAIAQAMVTLAHAMDIEVTAEGVETEQQAGILATLGCNTLQGFLFSAAVPRDRIEAMFADPVNAIARRTEVA